MFIILVGFTYAMVMANLWLPDKMSEIVNNGIIRQDMPAIWHNGLAMIVVTAAGGLCSIIIGFLASRIATGMAQKLRTELFERVESFALADFNKFSTASLITRSTNDIQQIQMTSILLLRLALMAPIMAIGGLQKAIHNAPNLSWIIALAVSVLLVVIAGVVRHCRAAVQKIADAGGQTESGDARKPGWLKSYPRLSQRKN